MTEEIDPPDGPLHLDAAAASALVIDLWRIQRRAEQEPATPERVRVACEIAADRARGLGFEVREMVGEPYHPSMRVQVIHREGGSRNLHVSDCLAPAVYYRGQLVQPAHVVVAGEGEDEGGTTDG